MNENRQRIKTSDITITAAMAALVFLGTYFFKIPTATGYVHIGDSMILLTVGLFGIKKGATAGIIGAGLSDLVGGYVYWVVPTMLIKCMWAVVMGLILYKLLNEKKGAFLIGAVCGGILHVAGYGIVCAILYGVPSAIVEIPSNSVQTGAGILIGFVIYRVLVRSGVAARLTAVAQ